MIDEVVNSILEAEDEAKRRVADAEAKAADVLEKATQRADGIRHEAAAQSKQYFRQQSEQANDDAAKEADKLLAARKKAVFHRLEKSIFGLVFPVEAAYGIFLKQRFILACFAVYIGHFLLL